MRQKTNSKMIDLNLSISIITLKVNSLKIPIKAEIIRSDKTAKPSYMLPTGNMP